MARKHKKLEDWRPIVDAFWASGQSVSAFCRERGLKREYFLNRRKALREQDLQALGQPVGFEQVQAPKTPSVSHQALALQWGSARLELSSEVDPSWVAAVMKELADAPVS